MRRSPGRRQGSSGTHRDEKQRGRGTHRGGVRTTGASWGCGRDGRASRVGGGWGQATPVCVCVLCVWQRGRQVALSTFFVECPRSDARPAMWHLTNIVIFSKKFPLRFFKLLSSALVMALGEGLILFLKRKSFPLCKKYILPSASGLALDKERIYFFKKNISSLSFP